MIISLTIPDLAKLQAFYGWQAMLNAHLLEATQQSIDDMETYAQGYMYSTFKDPQGPLEDNFTQDVEATQGQLINDSPYAWRREMGFSGKTDRLGRFFANDPGIAYMDTTLTDNIPNILSIYSQAVSDALAELAGGA